MIYFLVFIGGFAKGAQWAGCKWENHFYSETEEYCVKLYKQNFPDSKYLGDIAKIDFEKLKKDYAGEWILTGGFPCTDISIAGKGAGIHGKRSSLWFEYWRAICLLRPRYAIIENVPALTFRGFDVVLSNFAEIGYDAEWQTISAAEMGASHQRKRLWILAYPNGIRINGGTKNDNRGSEPNNEIERPNCREKQKGLANSNSTELQEEGAKQQATRIARSGSQFDEMANSNCKRFKKGNTSTVGGKQGFTNRQSIKTEHLKLKENIEPAVCRKSDGLSNKFHRIKGLGNSIVPQIAQLLFMQIKKFC